MTTAYPAPFVITRTAIDTVSWTNIVRPAVSAYFNHVRLYNSDYSDLLVRTDAADAGTETRVVGGNPYVIGAQNPELYGPSGRYDAGRFSSLAAIVSIKAVSGVGPVIAEWSC